MLDGAVEQASARNDGFNDALVGAGELELDPVTAGDVALFATRYTVKDLLVHFDLIMSSVAGDDATFD